MQKQQERQHRRPTARTRLSYSWVSYVFSHGTFYTLTHRVGVSELEVSRDEKLSELHEVTYDRFIGGRAQRGNMTTMQLLSI